MNTNWFTSRNLKVLEYQQNAITKVQQSLNEHEITVLAACPSAGKTLMTIYMIEEYLRQNPNHNILVLTHGTTVLRTQFHDVLEKYKPNFTYALIESCKDYQNSSASVNVCLPQSLHKCQLKKADLLICDEAHQFYFAKMVKKIINDTKVKKQLLLTGTPSQFILNKDKFDSIIPVALNTIFDAGMVSDVYVEIASSTYNFDLKDYNDDDELKSSVHFKDSDTRKTLDALIEKIDKRLKSIRNFRYTNLVPEWLPVLKSMEKTMMVCKSQHQAKQVQKYFEKRDVPSALSISDTDIDSREIERFRNEKDVLVLIVVGRGILGFNYEELVNVIDMTVSHNVDRLYQLFCRVVRKHPNGNKKLYFKIAPNMLTDYFKHIMTATMMLTQEEFFVKFNGKNFYQMEIPVKKVVKRKSNPEPAPDNGSKKRQKKYQPIDMEGLPVFQLFKNILHKKDDLLTPYAMTTIRQIRDEFLNIKHWTKEECIEDALLYTKASEWCKNSTAYHAAQTNGWYEECTAHMPKAFQWTKEMCIEDARKFTNKTDWKNANGTPIAVARRNGWLDECCAHMEVLCRKPWTKEECKADALKYKTLKEWRNGENGSAYTIAIRNGWLDECCAHMPKYYIEWTLEMCKEIALKHKTKSEWQINNSASYSIARKRGWLDECCIHMENNYVKNYWTKERCIESAKKYNTVKDWKMNEPSGAEASARRNGWMNECTAHMIQIRKPIGYWTKERCIESARKYKTRVEWAKGEDKSACHAAQKNGWYDECVIHMKNFHTDWTKEMCLDIAKKYKSIAEWQKNEGGAYQAAVKLGWKDECCAHMIRIAKPDGYWTLERCKEIALQYKTAKEWIKNNGSSYSAAQRNGWLKECGQHFIQTRKPVGYWEIKENVINAAKKVFSITEFIKTFAQAYNIALKNGWLEECKKYFKKNDDTDTYFELVA